MAIYNYQKHPSAMLPDEVDMPEAVITVFGGTGFLDSAIVRTLLRQGARVRVAARRPERLQPCEHPERLTALQTDVTDAASIAAALDGCRAVVNAVGLVDDVAQAVARVLEDSTTATRICELGGPRIYTYREIIDCVLHYRRRRRVLMPVPFGIWTVQAKLLAVVPNAPLTEDQVILMREDNVVGEGVVTLKDLGVAPRSIEDMLPVCFRQGPGAAENC